jgi:hypothetical protein
MLKIFNLKLRCPGELQELRYPVGSIKGKVTFRTINKHTTFYEVVHGSTLTNIFDFFTIVKYLCTDTIAGRLGRESK